MAYPPAPTYADVILVEKDPKTGKEKGSFNPVWLDWFLRLTKGLPTNSEGVAGFANVVGPSPEPLGPGFGENNFVLFGSTEPGSPFVYVKDSNVQIDRILWAFADNEPPLGDINGGNVVFTLAHNIEPTQSIVIYHKLKVPSVSGIDFIVSPPNTITFTLAPAVGDWMRAFYRYTSPP